MNDFLKKVVTGNGDTPSDACLESFNQNFKGAINVEWFNREDSYEVIFYKTNLEYIAVFDLEGNLREYKVNFSADYLPEPIKKNASRKGEIMNCVMRNKGNSLEYEIIVRDKELNRYLIILTDLGEIIKEKKL